MQKKVLVIGIDGGSWNVINPLIKKGGLENLNKLLRQGVRANLESCLPSVTAPAWKCYSTGKNPGKLGMYWWQNVDIKNKKFVLNTSLTVKEKEIWDLLSENGKRSYVLNMPLTYPAKKINGAMISGPIVAFPEKAFYPPELQSLFPDYQFFPEANFRLEKEKLIQEIYTITEKKVAAAKKFITRSDWDFFQFTFFMIDDLQHFFWKYQDKPHHPLQNTIQNFWQFIDQKIGELLKLVPEPQQTYTILFSDHGFTSLKATFFINEWLRKNGYLSLRNDKLSHLLLKLGISAERIGKMVKFLGLLEFAKKRMKNKNLKVISMKAGKSLNEQIVDWEKTKAVATSEGPLYFNQNILSSEEIQSLKKELSSKLQKVKFHGKVILHRIMEANQIYNGPCQNSPDFILWPEEGYEISGLTGQGQILSDSQEGWSATHKRNGIFLITGPHINSTSRVLEKVNILDLAPTILHLLDIPLPKDLDGRILKEIFS
ncbi:MAG: alkaline phosphatase family protein [Candidatus Doudnabacteria bacterium]